MASTQHSPPRSGLVTGSRWALTILAAIFTVGAFSQFFLVGMGMFEDGSRWQDHASLGHVLGLVTYLLWIPAVLGKTGARLIVPSLALLVLFGLQYAFIESDNTMMNAFHPLNGSVLLVLGFWVTLQARRLLKVSSTEHIRARQSETEPPGTVEGAPSSTASQGA